MAIPGNMSNQKKPKTTSSLPPQKDAREQIHGIRIGTDTLHDKNTRIWLIGILLSTILVYFPALSNELVNWDDDSYILNNPLILDLSVNGLITLFTEFYTGNYHPLTLLSYAIEHSLVGNEPFLYHLNNLILHLINCGLLFWFLIRYTGNTITTGITTLLFAIHPLHVESVAWAAERKDVLYTCFFFLSMIWYERYKSSQKISDYIILSLFFIASCLSKGMAVVLPGALIALEYAKGRNFSLKLIWENKIPLWVISLAFGIIAIIAQEKAIRDEKIFSHADNIFIASYGYVLYLVKTLVPYPLSCFYPYPLKNAGTLPPEYYAALGAVGISAFIAWKFRNKARWAVGAFLFFVATIIMVSQILPVGAAVAADRYFYLASVGIFLIVGESIRRGIQAQPSRQNFYLAFILVISTLYAGVAWKRVKVWENSYVLFSDVIEQYPFATFAYNNIGTYFQLKKEPQKAMEFYLKSVQVNKNYDLGYINLAIAFNDLKQFDKAIEYGERGMQLNPKSYDGWASLAFAYDNMKQHEKAVSAYRKANQLQPDNKTILLNMANALRNAGQWEEAIGIYEAMLKEKPDNADVLNNLGYTLAQLKRFQEAEELLKKAMSINPKLSAIYNNLGYTYAMQGRFAESIAIMEESIRQNPKSAESYNNLGNAYGMQGQNDKAVQLFRQSIEVDSTFSDAWNNLGIAYLNLGQNDLALQHYLKAAKLGNVSARGFLEGQGVDWRR
jgi:tetratricopeptide (TPR) repeat protein